MMPIRAFSKSSIKEMLTQYVKVGYLCNEASLQRTCIAFCSTMDFCADSQRHGGVWILSGHQGAPSLKRPAGLCWLQTPSQTKLAAGQ